MDRDTDREVATSEEDGRAVPVSGPDRRASMSELVERSSLGTPEARELRERTSDAVAAEILDRVGGMSPVVLAVRVISELERRVRLPDAVGAVRRGSRRGPRRG